MRTFLLLLTAALLISSCGQTKQVTVILRMMPEQEKYFKERILPPFEKKNKCKVNVEAFDSPLSVDTMITARKGTVALVKMPFEATRRNAETGLYAPLDSLVTAKQVAELQEKYFLMPLAASHDKLYYLPRKFETRILVYLKSKVADARRGWGEHREA
ncbi:MAG: hypothetical protein JNL74_16860, partial [Fibrobacteres bacterium]|nr:hypothetical protein [Fibrobacterota bacterium]